MLTIQNESGQSQTHRQDTKIKEDKEAALPLDWMEYLGSEFSKDYMKNLRLFLQEELNKKKVLYPPMPEIFNAFKLTPFNKVKVVIIGQDPYHGPHQAHGLCFSVRPDVPIPPSLNNIYKELKQDMGLTIPKHGFLESWAKQGVLLLNAVLTVEASKAGAHQNKGWELFTDAAVSALNQHKDHLVFFLWGAYAQKKGAKIDRKKHLVLESVHPSPLSAHRGFFGTKPFSKANDFLKVNNLGPVNWEIK